MRDQRPIGESWITTRWRLNALAHPSIHRDEQGAQSPGILVRIRVLLPFALGRQKAAGNMLGAGKQVDPHVGWYLRIRPTVERRMGERRGAPAPPVFGG